MCNLRHDADQKPAKRRAGGMLADASVIGSLAIGRDAMRFASIGRFARGGVRRWPQGRRLTRPGFEPAGRLGDQSLRHVAGSGAVTEVRRSAASDPGRLAASKGAQPRAASSGRTSA